MKIPIIVGLITLIVGSLTGSIPFAALAALVTTVTTVAYYVARGTWRRPPTALDVIQAKICPNCAWGPLFHDNAILHCGHCGSNFQVIFDESGQVQGIVK